MVISETFNNHKQLIKIAPDHNYVKVWQFNEVVYDGIAENIRDNGFTLRFQNTKKEHFEFQKYPITTHTI